MPLLLCGEIITGALVTGSSWAVGSVLCHIIVAWVEGSPCQMILKENTEFLIPMFFFPVVHGIPPSRWELLRLVLCADSNTLA